MPPTESMFLIGESREQPMHVGSLQLFDLPKGAGRGHIREAYDAMLRSTEVARVFRERPHRSLTTLGQWSWVEDDVDLEYHVRHSALPRPGRVRELLALTSRLHGTLLDRHRPMWEFHIIEGLEGNRFAVYTKLHHSVMDGISGLRLLQRSLTTDPEVTDLPPFWAPRPSRHSGGGGSGGVGALAGTGLHAARDLLGVGPAALKVAQKALVEHTAVLPGQAPRSVLNVGISGARRFAAQSWPMDRLREVGKAYGATVNDVVLAMCGGALRGYLLDLDALPDAALVAMTPVSLRRGDDDESTGNAVGTALSTLATDVADPVERLERISASMTEAKELLGSMSRLQVTALSALMLSPLLFETYAGSLRGLVRPPYNVVISNVPGPREPLYFNGARLRGIYPLSIPTQGQALNITVTSYAGNMEFGLTGSRRELPHLQRLLHHLDDELDKLGTRAAA